MKSENSFENFSYVGLHAKYRQRLVFLIPQFYGRLKHLFKLLFKSIILKASHIHFWGKASKREKTTLLVAIYLYPPVLQLVLCVGVLLTITALLRHQNTFLQKK